MVTSCQKEIELDFTDFESDLVVNGVFNPNEKWMLDISKSANVFDPNSYIEKIQDANVSVQNLETGEITQLIHSLVEGEKGLYTSSSFPQEFVNYKLVVEKDGFTTATAVNKIPSEIDVDFIDTSLVEIEGERALQIDFTIRDNAGEENFYVWDLLYSTEEDYDNNNNSDISPTSSDATLESVDDNTEILNEENNFQSKLFLTDGNFNGSNYSTTFLTFDENIVDGSSPNVDVETENLKLQLRVLAVSKELYEYLKSVEASYRSQNINSSNINPVDIDFNVEGGLGIFGAYKMHLIDIE